MAGCGSDSSNSGTDRTAAACARIADAVCAKWVECKVVENGATVTAATCAQVRSQLITSCQQDEGAGIASATDGEVDACVSGFQQFQCANLCNQVPQDPPACQTISPKPNTTSYTCM
jgi:hypothetical protein